MLVYKNQNSNRYFLSYTISHSNFDLDPLKFSINNLINNFNLKGLGYSFEKNHLVIEFKFVLQEDISILINIINVKYLKKFRKSEYE